MAASGLNTIRGTIRDPDLQIGTDRIGDTIDREASNGEGGYVSGVRRLNQGGYGVYVYDFATLHDASLHYNIYTQYNYGHFNCVVRCVRDMRVSARLCTVERTVSSSLVRRYRFLPHAALSIFR